MTKRTEFGMVAALATCLLLGVFGSCFRSDHEPVEQSKLPPVFITSTMWVHYNTGSALRDNENVYSEIMSRHPHYGIAKYTVRDTTILPGEERRYVTDTLLQIRDRFGDAYRDGTLTYYCPPRDCEFDIKYICVLLLDMNHPRDAGYYARAHKVGFIFSADDVFATDVDVAAIFDRALMRDPAPVEYDPEKTKLPDGFVSQSRGTFYRIIERHSAEHAEKTVLLKK